MGEAKRRGGKSRMRAPRLGDGLRYGLNTARFSDEATRDAVQIQLVAMAREVLAAHGLSAFVATREHAAWHEAGHVTSAAMLGFTTERAFVEQAVHPEAGETWGGGSEYPDRGAWRLAPSSPPEEDCVTAMLTIAGLGAEREFVERDQRQGSSLDEQILFSTACNWLAEKLGDEPRLHEAIKLMLMARVRQMLHHAKAETAAVAQALMERMEIGRAEIAPLVTPIMNAWRGAPEAIVRDLRTPESRRRLVAAFMNKPGQMPPGSTPSATER